MMSYIAKNLADCHDKFSIGLPPGKRPVQGRSSITKRPGGRTRRSAGPIPGMPRPGTLLLKTISGAQQGGKK
jgi:hypothetical protein